MITKTEIDRLNALFGAQTLTPEAATQLAFEEGAFLAQEAIARTMLGFSPSTARPVNRPKATDMDYANLDLFVTECF